MSASQQAMLLAQVSDPYFDEVILLLHMNGANQSFSVPDSSSYAHTMSFTYPTDVNFCISTTNPKFGSASLRNNTGAAGLLLYTPTTATFALGTVDWTVEYWMYCTNYDWGFRTHFNLGSNYLAFFTSGGNIVTQYNFGAGNKNPGAIGLANNTWNFISVVRTGTTIQLFVDGILRNTNTTGAAADMGSAATYISIIGGTPTPSYVDEFRVTKGVARYSTNFTPPDAPFPNS